MIEALKKYPKTFRKFENYMMNFSHQWEDERGIKFTPPEIGIFENYHLINEIDMPSQFLIGCIMEFLGENRINVSLHSAISECFLLDLNKNGEGLVVPDKTKAFEMAFKILEERR